MKIFVGKFLWLMLLVVACNSLFPYIVSINLWLNSVLGGRVVTVEEANFKNGVIFLAGFLYYAIKDCWNEV